MIACFQKNKNTVMTSMRIIGYPKASNEGEIKAKWCVAQIRSRIKGHHVYDYRYTVNEELMCLRDDNNKYSNNAIKVLSNVEKKKKKGCRNLWPKFCIKIKCNAESVANIIDESSH